MTVNKSVRSQWNIKIKDKRTLKTEDDDTILNEENNKKRKKERTKKHTNKEVSVVCGTKERQTNKKPTGNLIKKKRTSQMEKSITPGYRRLPVSEKREWKKEEKKERFPLECPRMWRWTRGDRERYKIFAGIVNEGARNRQKSNEMQRIKRNLGSYFSLLASLLFSTLLFLSSLSLFASLLFSSLLFLFPSPSFPLRNKKERR